MQKPPCILTATEKTKLKTMEKNKRDRERGKRNKKKLPYNEARERAKK